jgi:hypothetical protein
MSVSLPSKAVNLVWNVWSTGPGKEYASFGNERWPEWVKLYSNQFHEL